MHGLHTIQKDLVIYLGSGALAQHTHGNQANYFLTADFDFAVRFLSTKTDREIIRRSATEVYDAPPLDYVYEVDSMFSRIPM